MHPTTGPGRGPFTSECKDAAVGRETGAAEGHKTFLMRHSNLLGEMRILLQVANTSGFARKGEANSIWGRLLFLFLRSAREQGLAKPISCKQGDGGGRCRAERDDGQANACKPRIGGKPEQIAGGSCDRRRERGRNGPGEFPQKEAYCGQNSHREREDDVRRHSRAGFTELAPVRCPPIPGLTARAHAPS